MNWEFLDSQQSLKFIVVLSIAVILLAFIDSSLSAILVGQADFGLPLRAAFGMLLVLFVFFEFNVI